MAIGQARDGVAGIVLAAGKGSRLDATKQLLPLQGRPLLVHVVRAAEASSLAEVVVVLGHDAGRVAAALPPGRACVIHNPRYDEGQSTSLQAGLRALGKDIEAALVLLGDQPGVRTEVIDAVAAAYGAAHPAGATGSHPLVVIPTYGGQDGHPVLLDRALWPEVMAVQGDQGARAVIRAHAEAVLRVPVDDGPPPPDVDTADDYAALVGEEGQWSL